MLGSMAYWSPALPESKDTSDAGRQVEAECQGLTFEDMFNYSHADFEVVIHDDWESAYVRAIAWVNGTLADDVRVDFDSLFEPLGTDNGWLSTDEYRTVRAIAAECVEQTNPRIGFRSGAPHRGGDGVNWYNASWINTDENPMVLEEWNLMPGNHANERDCTSSPTEGCVEIPTVPFPQNTGDHPRNCDTTKNVPDECRMIIWLNATLEFDSMGLMAGGSDEFTIAMNTSNMTKTDLHLTFPQQNGLRVDMFEECDGRAIDQAHNDYQGSAPTRGGCTSDNTITSASRLVNIEGETRLKLDTHIEYDMAIWPDGQDMFYDMTTTPPDVDDPPTWTTNAPAESDIIPIADDGRVLFLTGSQMQAWATDDQGTPLITCIGASGWQMTSDADGLSAIAPAGEDMTMIECKATDSNGQNTTETRNYTLQVPIRPTGDVIDGMAQVTLVPTTDMPAMEVTVTLTQTDVQYSAAPVTLNAEKMVELSLDSMSPGPMMVHISATGNGMSTFMHTYDLSIDKISSPPSISITLFEWIEDDFQIRGYFNDPDGDSVTITATNNQIPWSEVDVTGNEWMFTGPGLAGASTNLIEITTCDTWGKCSSVQHEAGATPATVVDNTPPPKDDDDDDDSGLPGFGLLAALGAFALAGLRASRRD